MTPIYLDSINVSFIGRIGADILPVSTVSPRRPVQPVTLGESSFLPFLAAMAVPSNVGMGAIRFSLGRTTTEAEIDDVVGRLRELIPAMKSAV